MSRIKIYFGLTLLILSWASHAAFGQSETKEPRIVNIINFVRLLEPREPDVITQDVLFQTVAKEIEMMRKHKLRGTFLLQYDALMDKRYQNLFKSLPRDSFEVGAWWEIPQPLVEKAGYKWRGRYPWDWHANVGFSVGYTQSERKKLANVYMKDFKSIFGYYPKSVGCWYIDEYTLHYLYKNYGIESAAICRDQVGTDGYTLWGGYWNQGYYPSKRNLYMPAQRASKQIPVPVFRMLGSDPVRQYDNGLGGPMGVITLEPVYENAGGNKNWVNWFFKEFVNGEAMEFAYVQAGQENSFTWNRIKPGYEIQMPLIDSLRNIGDLRVETLLETGRWFKNNFQTTPATSITVTDDIDDSDLKTVWFNSRFFRANFLWENNNLRIRDIHLFNEKMQSGYYKNVTKTERFDLFTLPFVDGYFWSTKEKKAGVRFKMSSGEEDENIIGNDPIVTSPSEGNLNINWPLQNSKDFFNISITERMLNIAATGLQGKWFIELDVAENKNLPFTKISTEKISCNFKGMKYSIKILKGAAHEVGGNKVFRIYPDEGNVISLSF